MRQSDKKTLAFEYEFSFSCLTIPILDKVSQNCISRDAMQFSGNFMISGNFAKNFLFCPVHKNRKVCFSKKFYVFQEILTIVTDISV